jgi:hypothetical protein
MLHSTGIPCGIPKSNALAIAAKRYKRVQNLIICWSLICTLASKNGLWSCCRSINKCSILVCTVGGNLRRPGSGSALWIRIHKKEKKNVLWHSGFSYADEEFDTNQDTPGKLPPTWEAVSFYQSFTSNWYFAPVYNRLLCPMLPCTRIPGGILYPPHGGIAAKR